MAKTYFEQAVSKVLESTKPGDVISYGELALEAGYPGAARAVGNYLRNCEEPLPWWRVVAANGRLHPHGYVKQAELLQAEKVAITRKPSGYFAVKPGSEM